MPITMNSRKNASVKVSGFADLRLLTVRRFFVLLISSLPFILRCFDNEKASGTNISFADPFKNSRFVFLIISNSDLPAQILF